MRTLALTVLLYGGCYDDRINAMDIEMNGLRSSLNTQVSALNAELAQLRQQNVELVEAMEQSADLQPRVAALEVSRDASDAVHAQLQAQVEALSRIADQEAAILALQEQLWRLEEAQALEHNGSAQLAALGGLLTLSPLIPLWSGRLRRRDA